MSNDAHEILEAVQTAHERVQPHLRDGAEWFHEREGNLFERDEATENLADDLDIDDDLAGELVSQLVSDTVDPVVQIKKGSTRHVGVIEFHEYEGAYGYVEYDDLHGQAKRVVCQQCVNEAELDSEVVHATAGDPHGSFGDVGYEELLDGINQHYEDSHEAKPSEVETGASLASGTTIGGNTAYHTGNSSSYSDSDAVNAVDGSSLSSLNISDYNVQPTYQSTFWQSHYGSNKDLGTMPGNSTKTFTFSVPPVITNGVKHNFRDGNGYYDFKWVRFQNGGTILGEDSNPDGSKRTVSISKGLVDTVSVRVEHTYESDFSFLMTDYETKHVTLGHCPV